MIIAITFPTSAAFWLNYSSKHDLISFSLTNRKLVFLPDKYDFHLNAADAMAIAEAFDLPLPLTLIAPEAERRYNNKNVNTLVRHRQFPKDSFVELSHDFCLPDGNACRILVASPEMTFLQSAYLLDPRAATILGCELCGTYIYDANAEFCQRSRQVITSSEEIRKFIERNAGCAGVKQARSISRYISDGSNSRMETQLSILANLRFPYGGYKLAEHKLNITPHLSEEAKASLGNRNIFCDMVWEKEKVVVEYDSDLTHLSSKQHMLDVRRANALQRSGYTVFTITKNDVSSLSHLDRTFMTIRKELKMRNAESKLVQYESRRRELMQVFRTFKSHDMSTYSIWKRRRK